MKKHFLAVLLVAAVLCSAASAAIFEDDFDSYAEGSNINGQGGWVDWSGPTGAGAIVDWVGTIDSDQILNIEGGSDLVYEGWNLTSDVISFDIKQYIPSTATGTTYLILLNEGLAAPDWAMQLKFDLDAGTVQDDVRGSGTFNVLTDQWVKINAEIDLNNNTVEITYGGTLIRDAMWSDASVKLDAIDLYANGADSVYYDDLSITLVPEPATLALLGLGGLALIRKRK